jgi:hypothetical protein
MPCITRGSTAPPVISDDLASPEHKDVVVELARNLGWALKQSEAGVLALYEGRALWPEQFWDVFEQVEKLVTFVRKKKARLSLVASVSAEIEEELKK